MKHLYGLDFIRFASAFLVLLFHLSTFSLVSPEFSADESVRAFGWLHGIGVGGWVGVQIFFVISGFVITASAQKSKAGDFLVRRSIRVFPALWVCSLIALSVQLCWGEEVGPTVAAFARSVILSPQGPYIDGVVWTLVLEAVFYIYVAGLILVGNRLGRSVLQAGGMILGAVSAVFLSLYMLVDHYDVTFAGIDLEALLSRFPLKVALLWHGVFFALGMLIYQATRTRLTRLQMLAVGVFGVFGVAEILQDADSAYESIVAVSIWLVGTAGIFASVFMKSLSHVGTGGEWLRKLGLMTYPLYLNHFTFGMYLTPWLAQYIENRTVLLVVVMGILLVAAYLVMIGPERWLQSAARQVRHDYRIARGAVQLK